MARNRQRIDGLPSAEGGYEKRQGTSVHARPTSLPSPQASKEVNELTQALTAIEPGLTAFVRSRQKEEAQKEQAAGMAARAGQEGNAPVLTPEQSPWFQQGYMLMHGKVSGGDTARRMRSMYDSNKNIPGFNPDSALKEFMAGEMQGMNDEDVLQEFLPLVLKERDSILNDWQKQQVEAVRSDTAEQLFARARDIVTTPIREDEEGVVTNPAQTRHALYQQFLEDGRNLGKTRPELAEMFTASLVQAAIEQRDPRILDVANIKDSRGVALIENAQFGKVINDARAKAETLQKEEMYKSLTGARTETLLEIDELIRNNPHHPLLDLDNLKLHAHPNGLFNDPDGKELAAKWEEVLKARKAKIDEQVILRDLQGPNARFTAARPEAKPVMQAVYGRLWDELLANMNSQDENTRAAAIPNFIAQNLGFHQAWGVNDERLKSLLTRINTETLPDGRPSSEFQKAYQIYAAIKESPNADLLMDLTDERSRTMLRYYHDMILEGTPAADAMQSAKQLMAPEAQERYKALATPQVREAFRSRIMAALNDGSWYMLGLDKAANPEQFVAQLTSLFERKLMLLGSVTDAEKHAISSIGEYLVRDSNDNWTQRPDSHMLNGRSQRDFEKGLKAYTLDLTAVLKEEEKQLGLKERKFQLQRVGQGDRYIVMINGIPTGAQVTAKEIMARGDVKRLSEAEVTTLGNFAARAKERGAASLTGAEIDARWAEVIKLHQLGTIDARVYETLAAKRRAHQKQIMQDATSMARDAKSKMLGGMDPRRVLEEPGAIPDAPSVNPGGKNLKTSDYALHALKKGNLTFALTAQAEGFMTRVHDDPSKGQNIGLGFSVTSRSKPEVQSMLRRAGVPADQVEAVLKGKAEVAPDVVIRLHDIAVGEYEKKAISAIGGAEHWARLTPEAKAVLTDMAWSTGNPAQFKTVLDAMRKGDWKTASANLRTTYVDKQTGERKEDTRRVQLWRYMLSGRNTFEQYLSKHTSK